jgi:hypothetical protein
MRRVIRKASGWNVQNRSPVTGAAAQKRSGVPSPATETHERVPTLRIPVGGPIRERIWPNLIAIFSGSISQSGTFNPLPVVKIGGIQASVQYAGLVSPESISSTCRCRGNIPDGDQSVVATYGGASTQTGTLITIQH